MSQLIVSYHENTEKHENGETQGRKEEELNSLHSLEEMTKVDSIVVGVGEMIVCLPSFSTQGLGHIAESSTKPVQVKHIFFYTLGSRAEGLPAAGCAG